LVGASRDLQGDQFDGDQFDDLCAGRDTATPSQSIRRRLPAPTQPASFKTDRKNRTFIAFGLPVAAPVESASTSA